MHESENLTRIFAEEAKARQGTRTDLVATLPQGSEGDHKTRTKVAEPVGMKPRTYAKVKAVHDTANDTAASEPIRAVAQQQMAALDAGETTPNAAPAAPGASEAPTPDNPSGASSQGFWARVRRVFGGE